MPPTTSERAADELTERQAECLVSIEQLTKQLGHPPTIREVADALSLKSTHPAYRLLMALYTKGYVTWTSTPRTLEVLKPATTAQRRKVARDRAKSS